MPGFSTNSYSYSSDGKFYHNKKQFDLYDKYNKIERNNYKDLKYGFDSTIGVGINMIS